MMKHQTIRLDHIHAHPANSNVMPGHLVAKLADHIARSDRYPPLIVRPITVEGNRETPGGPCLAYQILDGHHRAQALRKLDRESAQCSVWEVDDDEALMLLATLNRLQGQDDPAKRAALVGRLTESHDLSCLTRLLPERREQIKKLLEINAGLPAPRPPQPVGQMPLAVHFFLLPEQKRRLDSVLKQLGGTREQALLALLDQHTFNVSNPPLSV
jgi:ParB family transcriptional regulator, chromosome partitioning protein